MRFFTGLFVMYFIAVMVCLVGCHNAKYGYMKSGNDGKNGVNGVNGINGQDGSGGTNGVDGTSCTVAQVDAGALITCGDTAAIVHHGQDAVQPTLTYICHVPPGNPANSRPLYVPNAALQAHYDHGDYDGECQ